MDPVRLAPSVAVGRDPVVRVIEQSQCEGWGEEAGSFQHHSGRFFRVIGVRTAAEDRVMIDQPEVGLLAFLVTAGTGPPSVLVQWKAEPGNVGLTQAGPTVQATRSNMDRVHGGSATVLLADVLTPEGRITDVLGSEQGDRFLLKSNRDVLRVLDDPEEALSLPVSPQHEWVDRDRMSRMLLGDFILNTDARSVLAVSPWALLAQSPTEAFVPLSRLLDVPTGVVERSRLTRDRHRCEGAERMLRACDRASPWAVPIALDELRGHLIHEGGVLDGRGTQVLGWFDVTLPTREVQQWCQPLLMQSHVTRCVLVLSVRDGCLVLGLRASIEGGWTRAEFGPTLQTAHDDELLAALDDRGELRTVAAIEQSDEGGRFYRSVARYELSVYDGDLQRFGQDVAWVTLAEAESFARRSGMTTNELRSCFSVMLAFA